MWAPILISLKVALISTILVLCCGTLLARIMSRKDFPGKNLLETLFNLPMVLPPTVVGFALLILFGKNGPLGALMGKLFATTLIFTWWAGVLAAMVVSFPLMYKSARTAFEMVDVNMENVARTLGRAESHIFFTITLPLSWPGLLAGVALAFTRALGEFGATLMVAGNIPGKTQTIPVAIYTAVETGDTAGAWWLVLVVTVLSFLSIYLLNSWTGRKLSREGSV